MTTRVRALRATSLLLAVTAAFSGWATNREAEPQFKATSMVVTGSLDQVALAITKAFANGAYHGKGFFAPPYDFVMKGQVRIAVPLTNTWNLCVPDKGWLPLTLVPLGKSMAAYDENFSINAEALTADSTRVSVTPQGSSVTEDKYDRSPHLALVLRASYHAPIPSETTNLFSRIKSQLREIQAGRTNALPPTPDTAPGFYSHFWRDLDVKQKHDSDNWKKMVQSWKALQASSRPRAQPMCHEAAYGVQSRGEDKSPSPDCCEPNYYRKNGRSGITPSLERWRSSCATACCHPP